MKDDYLWDKSGSDAELERLEGLLSVYRHSGETVARSNVIEFPSRVEGVRRQWLLPMAAGVALGAIGISAWTVSNNLSETGLPESAHATMVALPENLPVPPVMQNAPVPEHSTVGRKSVIRSKKARVSTPGTTVASRIRHRKRAGKPLLTRDEAHAYNQLKLALSITGSKLQIVTDSVNGFDEKDTNNK